MKRVVGVLALTLFALASSANAGVINVSQNWGADGFSVYNFNLASASVVDIQWGSGYNDAEFSLFDGAGNFIILNDDQFPPPVFTLNPRITQALAAGSYSVLTSFCCIVESYFGAQGAVQVNTDGFNNGWYQVGGTGTLAGAVAHMTGNAFESVENLDIEYTIETDAELPEPATLLLLGGGLAGIAGRRRRNRRRA